MKNTAFSNQTIAKAAQFASFVGQGKNVELPDDDSSFFVFGSKNELNARIQNILNNIIAEQADNAANVFVHYAS